MAKRKRSLLLANVALVVFSAVVSLLLLGLLEVGLRVGRVKLQERLECVSGGGVVGALHE